ncbi:MAG TPA: hypothetical protein VE075_01570 [Thermoanaerobaculia bacterium]|nr:hypothetical protein [Thermoanaerobaculia bacterium]
MRRTRRGILVLLALLLLGVMACVERQPPARPEAAPESAAAATIRRERAYLLSPLEGYSQSIDPARRERLARAFDVVVTTGSVAAARQAAGELLAVEPNLAPAKVLAAQVDFAEGNNQAVVVRLLPVGDAQPNYTASQLVLGRAAELAGDVPLAYAAYRAIATRSGKAFERTGDLHARALRIVGERLQQALRAGRAAHPDSLAEAERDLALLKAWGPGELPTLEGARALAVARGDAKAELEAVKGLSARQPDERVLLERRAELEMAVGDPGAGLKLIQGMADRRPGDRELQEKLRVAKFRWRLSLLPADVRALAEKPELSRADLTVLLYWLVPEVRYAKATAGRIATDILDHPHREEIAHVVNLGLMDVDANLHRFSPEATVRRGAALRSLGRLLTGFGKPAGCAEAAGGAAAPPCELAASCSLTAGDEGAEGDGGDGTCRAGEPLSGPDAIEWIRRSLLLLGGA